MLKEYGKQGGNMPVVVIVVLVVVIVGGLGFSFWDHVQPKSQTISQNKTTTSTKPGAVGETLSLVDWSIKFTIPTGLAIGDIYDYKTHVGDAPDYYGFTTNRVRAQGGACDNEVTGNLVTLTRSTNKAGDGTLINSDAIDGYFYYEGSSVTDIDPTPACLTTSVATQDYTLLGTMIKSLSSL